METPSPSLVGGEPGKPASGFAIESRRGRTARAARRKKDPGGGCSTGVPSGPTSNRGFYTEPPTVNFPQP